jgi:iron complex transport system substrate-binding protein
VVSLACSNTEIACALGCAERLVGVDDHSDHPPEVVGRLPRLGPDLSIDVDAVVALRPDLVLASLTLPGHERVVEQLDRAGLRYIAPDPQSLADVARDIRTIAGLLEVPERGEALAEQFESSFVPRRASGVRVLVEWWPKPVIVPGRSSWVTQLLEAAGAVNPFGEREVRSTPVTDAEVVAVAPDVVVISWCGVPFHRYRRDVVLRRSAWAEVPAIREARVEAISEAYLGRPGPRLVEGFRRVCALVDSVAAAGQG